MALSWAVWCSRGAVLGAPLGSLRQFWGLLGRLGALLGRLGVLLAVWGVFWGRLGAVEESFRPSWVPPEALLGQLEALLGLSWAVYEPSWALLRPFWTLLGSFRSSLGPSWGDPGGFLGRF